MEGWGGYETWVYVTGVGLGIEWGGGGLWSE